MKRYESDLKDILAEDAEVFEIVFCNGVEAGEKVGCEVLAKNDLVPVDVRHCGGLKVIRTKENLMAKSICRRKDKLIFVVV